MTRSPAEGAMRRGVHVHQRTAVTGLLKDGDRVVGVETERGPIAASLVVSAVGGHVTALAAMTEIIAEPPYWLHAVLWIPLILFLSLVGLRLCKGWLIAAHYRHDFLNSDDPS